MITRRIKLYVILASTFLMRASVPLASHEMTVSQLLSSCVMEQGLSVRSEYALESQSVELRLGAFIPSGKRHKIDVRDLSFLASRSLGAVVVEAGDDVPTRISADPATGRYWNAKLEWQWVHY